MAFFIGRQHPAQPGTVGSVHQKVRVGAWLVASAFPVVACHGACPSVASRRWFRWFFRFPQGRCLAGSRALTGTDRFRSDQETEAQARGPRYGFDVVHVANVIVKDDAEATFALQVERHSSEATAGERVATDVEQRDGLGVGFALLHLYLLGLQIEGDLAGVLEVVGKVFLDQNIFEVEADDETVHDAVGVNCKDVSRTCNLQFGLCAWDAGGFVH